MSAHVFLSVLVFEHGFIQIRLGSFEFFTRYFSIKFYTIASLRSFHDIFYNSLLMRNITRWILDTEVKVFHESNSYFMKWPWNYISCNALKEKFHSVSFPLEFQLLQGCWTLQCGTFSLARYFKEQNIVLSLLMSFQYVRNYDTPQTFFVYFKDW